MTEPPELILGPLKGPKGPPQRTGEGSEKDFVFLKEREVRPDEPKPPSHFVREGTCVVNPDTTQCGLQSCQHPEWIPGTVDDGTMVTNKVRIPEKSVVHHLGRSLPNKGNLVVQGKSGSHLYFYNRSWTLIPKVYRLNTK